MPPVAPPYGMPGYAASTAPNAAPSAFPPAPLTPAVAPMTPTPPPPTGSVGGTGVLAPTALRVSIRDEAGRPQVIPVSPTAHAQNARLHPDYQNEFGLDVVRLGAHMHRRLIFSPEDLNSWMRLQWVKLAAGLAEL